MPTAPDPNSPFMDARAQAAVGGREPGTPSSAGQPGVTPGGFNFPSPPAPAAGPVGRPAASVGPVPPPPVAAPPPPKPAQPAPAAGGTQPAQTQPTGTQGAGQPPSPPQPATMTTVDAAGQPQATLTPEGKQQYQQAVVKLRNSLGPVHKIFRHPSLPEMPVELGQWNYNPATGIWGK